MHRATVLLAGVATCAAALVPPPAGAATILRTEAVLAASACQAALPAFEGQIRKRPIAVQNEGAAPAFVTCALSTTTFLDFNGLSSTVGIYLVNNGAADITVNCTLVDARSAFNDPIYQPRSIVLNPGRDAGSILWTAAEDNGGSAYVFPAISCNLPPGAGVNGTLRRFQEEIGG